MFWMMRSSAPQNVGFDAMRSAIEYFSTSGGDLFTYPIESLEGLFLLEDPPSPTVVHALSAHSFHRVEDAMFWAVAIGFLSLSW